jgi:glyoxylase-like metal-dependent hydrolase (beta-lactamase superfamily II)
MKPYTITALKMGGTKVPCAEIYWMTKLTGWEQLTFWAFLIENDERRILLNTGFPEDYSLLHKHWTTWAKSATGEEGHVPIVHPDNLIVNALRKKNLTPDQIDHVLVTPLTAYATGGLDQFKKSSIWISRRGWVDFHAPDPEVPQLPRHIVFPPDVLQFLVGEAAAKIKLLPDEETEFLPGIRSWFCGGHHRSSMGFFIETSKGVVGTTDAIFKYRNIEENIPLGLSESLEEHYKLFARMKRQAGLVLPLYDPLLIDRHKGGVIG